MEATIDDFSYLFEKGDFLKIIVFLKENQHFHDSGPSEIEENPIKNQCKMKVRKRDATMI